MCVANAFANHCMSMCRFGSISYVVKSAMVRMKEKKIIHHVMHVAAKESIYSDGSSVCRWNDEVFRFGSMRYVSCKRTLSCTHTHARTHGHIGSNSSVDDNVMRTKSVQLGLLMKRLFIVFAAFAQRIKRKDTMRCVYTCVSALRIDSIRCSVFCSVFENDYVFLIAA